MKPVMYLGNPFYPGTADTERGPSPQIWGWQGSPNSGPWDFLQDPRTGLDFWEDFKACGASPATGSAGTFAAENAWLAYLDTNGAITDSGIVGGGIHLAASTTVHQGVALGQLVNSYQLVDSLAALKGRLAFEARVQLSVASIAASTADMFVGLVDASGTPASGVPISATGGTMAVAAGFIGFQKRGGVTGPADWNFVYNVAGGTPVYAVNLQNLINTITGSPLVGGAFYKLGFVFDPVAELRAIISASTGQVAGVVARPMIQVYVNGQVAGAFLTTTNVQGVAFPNTLMSPAVAWKQQSTTAAVNADVDWVRIAQTTFA